MTTRLEIQNLKCNGCANTIINKLNNLDNIHEVSVDNETNTVSFNYSNDEQRELVKKTLFNIG